MERLTAPFSPSRAAARNDPHSPRCLFTPPLRKPGVRGDRCLLAPKIPRNHYMQSPLCPPRALTLILAFNLERNRSPSRHREDRPRSLPELHFERRKGRKQERGAEHSAGSWGSPPETARSASLHFSFAPAITQRCGGRGVGLGGAFRTKLKKHTDRNRADSFFTGTITGKTK